MNMKKVAAAIINCCIVAGMTATSVCAQDQHYTFDLLYTSNMIVNGVCFGQELVAQFPSANFAALSGTIEVIITTDVECNPDSIQFIGADISASDLYGYTLSPGIGGSDGSAPANVGLRDANDILNLTIRDMTFDVTSAQPIPLTGCMINQETIDFIAESGTVDCLAGIMSDSLNLGGNSLINDNSTMGAIIAIADQFELCLPFYRTIDISDSTNVAGDYLRFNGIISTTSLVPEPSSLALVVIGGFFLSVLTQVRHLKPIKKVFSGFYACA